MTSLLRLLRSRTILAALVIASAIVAGAQTRTPPPELKAIQEAMAIADPAAKLEALKKVLTDFPDNAQARSNAQNAILTVLVTSFKDREQEINEALDKILNTPLGGPASAASSPDVQLSRVTTIVVRLVDNNVVLDRAEALLAEAMGKLDRDAYVRSRRESMERALKMAEERQKANPSSNVQLPAIPPDSTFVVTFDRMRAGAIELRARIALAKGDSARAEKDFKDAFAANAALTRAPLELAKLASARGDDKAAIDYYLPLALTGKLKRAEEDAFASLYRKVNGGSVNLEADLDRLYREKYPNPIEHPEKYTGARSGRVALLEMFTGSACPPCVSADLALDAALDRYPADAIAVLAYHVHIPGPDPMTMPSNDVRRNLYAVPGVPPFNVDGARARLGGGARENTPMTYKAYVPVIDKALQTPPEADVKVAAVLEGSQVRVQATVGNIKGESKNLRLHLLLAEKHLKFLGENGIRFHPFVVRDAAGDKGGGLPITAGASATLDHTFNLAPIPETMTTSLADDIARRRKTEPAGGPREYPAEGHAMTKIDTSQIVAVAFVQDMNNTAPAAPTTTTTTTPSAAPTTATTTATTTAATPAGAQPPESAGVELTGPPSTRPAPTYKVLQASWTNVAPPTSAQRKE